MGSSGEPIESQGLAFIDIPGKVFVTKSVLAWRA